MLITLYGQQWSSYRRTGSDWTGAIMYSLLQTIKIYWLFINSFWVGEWKAMDRCALGNDHYPILCRSGRNWRGWRWDIWDITCHKGLGLVADCEGSTEDCNTFLCSWVIRNTAHSTLHLNASLAVVCLWNIDILIYCKEQKLSPQHEENIQRCAV